MSAHPLVVVGIGADGPAGLSAEGRSHVTAARILAGGRRHLAFFPEWTGETIIIEGDLQAVVGRLRERYRSHKTVVLASGDPLFYGIGRLLVQSFPREDLVFLPHVTSVQLAFARLKETWHDARIVSLHGRPMLELRPVIEARAPKIAVLTDGTNTPAAIGDFLRTLGAAEDYALWVCENLGAADERISCHVPAQLTEDCFSPLNVVVLLANRERSPLSPVLRGEGLGVKGSEYPVPSTESPAERTRDCVLGTGYSTPSPPTPLPRGERGENAVPLLGIPESALLHRPGPFGMITRREVRLLALCYLELHPHDVLWDIGAGSGSVAIEAARLSPSLSVFAVERNDEAFAQLQANVQRLAADRVRPIHAEAPHGLDDLPDPDAVFIGGSGGYLTDIITAVGRRLKGGARIVLNCITLENLARGRDVLSEQGLSPEVTSVQLAHSRPLGRLHSLEPDNLIFILRASKP